MLTMDKCPRKRITYFPYNDKSIFDSVVTLPTWCSCEGKVCERNKPRKVATPTWEIRSSYPSRQNIREYLNEDKSAENFKCSSKRTRRTCRKQKTEKRKTAATAKLILALLAFAVVGILSWNRLVDKECQHALKHVSASLLRAEQALRNTRIRRLMTIMSQTSKTDIKNSMYERGYIEGVTVTRARTTKEWGGRVALWGMIPLWRASPSPNVVLALRKPVPSDCWAFGGSDGELIIELPRKMEVHRMSIEHVRPDTAKSAPRKFILYGILENGTLITSIDAEYRRNRPTKQFFPLTVKISLRLFVLRFFSNHGNTKYTCVYRVHFYNNITG